MDILQVVETAKILFWLIPAGLVIAVVIVAALNYLFRQ